MYLNFFAKLKFLQAFIFKNHLKYNKKTNFKNYKKFQVIILVEIHENFFSVDKVTFDFKYFKRLQKI